MRNGQWVKFSKPDVPGAAKSKDGLMVGIFRLARTDPISKIAYPQQVVPMKPDGSNIRYLDQDNRAAIMAIDPAACEGLQPILNLDDIPQARRPPAGTVLLP